MCEADDLAEFVNEVHVWVYELEGVIRGVDRGRSGKQRAEALRHAILDVETMVATSGRLETDRVTNDTLYVQYLEDIQEFKKNRINTNISLNEEKRKSERKDKKKDTKEEDIILLESVHILCDLIIAG